MLKTVNYKRIVDDLYKTTISHDDDENKSLMKLIANVNIGMMEKGRNRSTKSFIFDTIGEAKQKQIKYGGTISVISKTNIVEIPPDEIKYTSEDDAVVQYKEVCDQDEASFYVLNISDEKELVNGFRYIKELLIQAHNFRMYSDYMTLTKNNIDVFSVKTDAFTIRQEDNEKAIKLLAFGDDIGNWRVDKLGQNIGMPFVPFAVEENLETPFFNRVQERIHLEDEYDVNEICEAIQKHKKVMIRALYPGCGKSYAAEHFATMGYKVLFVCPTNKLVQKYSKTKKNTNIVNPIKSVTMNKFLNMTINNTTTKKVPYDSSGFDVIVFDEIYFACVKKLTKIKQFVADSNKIVIGNGDTDQLEPINILTNTQDYNTYADSCIDQIFPYEICLEERKRLKTREHKQKLKQLKQDLFNEDIPVMETITKYFKFTNDMTNSLENIAYENKTCKSVSNTIRQKLGKKDDYEVGETLVCREHCILKDGVLNVNFEFKIIEVNQDFMILEDMSEEDIKQQFKVSMKIVRSSFIHAYCCTCHNYQGSSIDGKVTIFDYKHYFCSRKWLWTAITRATDLDNVYFYNYEDDVLNASLIRDYFEKNVKDIRGKIRLRIELFLQIIMLMLIGS